MRQRKTFVLVVVMLFALLLMPAQTVFAEATVIPCSGTMTMVDMPDLGVWTYPGGNVHIRHMVGVYQQVMTDDRCSGWNTVVANINWGADGTGPSWGTFHMEPDQDNGYLGAWDGTWSGITYADGTSAIHVVGDGFGDLEGMKVFVDLNCPMMGYCLASGYMLAPHGE